MHPPAAPSSAFIPALVAVLLAVTSGCHRTGQVPPQEPQPYAPSHATASPGAYGWPSTTGAPSASIPAPTASAPPEPPAPALKYCSAAFQAQFGWPDPDKAAKVCRCESSGNPRAVSGNGKYFGLFQFGSASWQTEGGGDVFDPFTNSHHAHRLFLRKGWRPWPHCGRD